MKRLSLCAVLLLLTVTLVAQRRAVPALGTVVPDLEQRLARFKVVRMPFNSAAFSARERQMIDQLVEASRFLESMFWRQSDPDGLALYKALANDATPVAKNVRRYAFPPPRKVHRREVTEQKRERTPFLGGRWIVSKKRTTACVDLDDTT